VTLRNMLFLTLPASVGLILLGEPIIRLLLERGAFNAVSTQGTAWALAFFALGLVGHAVVEITTRAFYALKNTKTPVAIAVAAIGVNVGLSLALMPLFERLGWPAHGGLALANSVAVTLEMAALLILLRPAMGGLTETKYGQNMGKIALATVGMALVLGVITLFLPANPKWLEGVVGILVGGLVYGGLAYLMGVDELKIIQQKIMARLKRKGLVKI
jgi:putative peptidoglycan lipid II flippase